MKLTNREVFLLKLLSIAAIIALSYYFIINPQIIKVTDLMSQLEISESEMTRVKTELKVEDSLKDRLSLLSSEAEEQAEPFYPDLIQKNLIVFMDDMLSQHNIKSDSISFSKPNIQSTTGGTLWMEMSVSFPFTAGFTDVMSFIEALEQQERMIIIDSIQFNKNSSQELSGSLNLKFYSLSKPTINARDQEYLDWPYSYEHGRENPFDDGLPDNVPATPDNETEEDNE